MITVESFLLRIWIEQIKGFHMAPYFWKNSNFWKRYNQKTKFFKIWQNLPHFENIRHVEASTEST